MAEVEKPQNPPNNKIAKFMDQEEEEDYISLLPDCLLIEIISRLNFTTEAIRTGTLSKRWQHLWPQVHYLYFSLDMDIFIWNDQRLADFVSFVDKTLTQCRQCNLNVFKLFCGYDTQFESHIKNWIRYALSCNVQDLHLSIPNKYTESEFVLDDQCFFINSSFTRLGLDGCILNPIGAISWCNLNYMFISKVKLDEDLIKNILSGSPLLETLELYHCYGFERIDITSKSVKNFELNGYDSPENDDHGDIIEINAPYILSLRITGYLLVWKLSLINVSSLAKANLDYIKLGHDETTRKEGKEEMLEALLQSLHHVEELNIGISCVNTLLRLEAKGFISLLNLKVVDHDSLVSSDSDSDRDLNGSGDSDGDLDERLLDDGLESEGGEVD